LTGINGGVDNTIDTMSHKSTVVRKRSKSQASANNTGRVSHHRRSNSDNMTSAYIIPDIDVTASKQEQERFSNAPVCGHGFPYQGPDQCDTCVRKVSSIVDEAQESSEDLSVLVPVSERMPAAVNGRDEPTIRPSMPPMKALAKVLRDLVLEEKDLKRSLAFAEYALRIHDSSLARTERDAKSARFRELHALSQKKADQIYFLYDVLEGLKWTEEWSGIED